MNIAPPPGIRLDKPWKQAVFDFTATQLQHTAWGLQHSERDYLMAKELAEKEHLDVNDDVLFAAAMLHDMGGFSPYAQKGVDHAVRSAQVCDTILKPAGFPEDEIPVVQKAIITHSYYDHTRPATPEAVVLHDADTLDFLGDISATRILSITERDPAAPDMQGAIHTLESLLHDAPQSLYLHTSQEIGQTRAAEMQQFLTTLKSESVDGQAL